MELSEISLKAAPSEDYLLKDGDIVFVRSLEEIYTKQLANCDELKQAFLAKAFNGKL